MKYYIRSTSTNVEGSFTERWVPRSMEEFKIHNQIMFTPFGSTEKKALPEFTVEDMGASETVKACIVVPDSDDADEERNSESADDTSGSSPATLPENAIDQQEYFQQLVNLPVLVSLPNSGVKAGNARSSLPCQVFSDSLLLGDDVTVYNFFKDSKWTPSGVIVAEGEDLNTWKIKVGNEIRDISKIHVVRAKKNAAATTPKAVLATTKTDSSKKKIPKGFAKSNPIPPTKKQKIEIKPSVLFDVVLATKSVPRHHEETCKQCLLSTWACPYNSINIKTAILLGKNGLTGYVTSSDRNLCLYRVLHALIPERIPLIDQDEVNAKKVILDIVKAHIQPPGCVSDYSDFGVNELLRELEWESECPGLHAGNIMQSIADHFQLSFNLYTVDLIRNNLLCEKFTSLNLGGTPKDWLSIVCVPGNGQLRGEQNYDLHYIPASEVGNKLPVHVNND